MKTEKTETKEIRIPLIKYLRIIGADQRTIDLVGKDLRLLSALHKHLKFDMSHKDTVKVVEKYVKDYSNRYGEYDISSRKYVK